MKKKLLLILMSTIFTEIFAADANFQMEPMKKLIKFGWDAPTPQFISENFAEIEKGMTPYDGMGIDFNSKNYVKDGRSAGSSSMMFGAWKWKPNYFEEETKLLKEANSKFKYLKYNFINTNTMAVVADRFDWFDDSLWTTINGNFAILASIAKETGCRGLNIDIENYERQTFLFNSSMGHSYEETWNKARQRGREFIKAITEKYPDIVIFTFFWLDQGYSCADGISSPYKNAEKQIMGLTIPFINGIYDALPETATIVEGMESSGYRANNPSDYNAIAALYRKKGKWLVDPKNYEKYLRRTQLGIATYLDRYILTDEKSIWFISKDDAVNLEKLKINLSAAMSTSDEYAWTWSEARSWYPWEYRGWMKKTSDRTTRPGVTFEKALPGITNAMIFAKNPAEYYRKRSLEVQSAENLLKNSGFDNPIFGNKAAPDVESPASILPWGFWQKPTSKGKVSAVDGCAKIEDVTGGCILQNIQINPKHGYFIRAKAKGNTENAILSVGWQDSTGRWNFWGYNVSVSFAKELPDGWKEASMLLTPVRIPPNAATVSVQVGTKNGGIVQVDSVECFELK